MQDNTKGKIDPDGGTNSLSLIEARGSEKNWKPSYIISLLMKLDKCGDKISDAADIGFISAEREQCIGFIPNKEEKERLRKLADDTIKELVETVKTENDGKLSDTNKISCHRIASQIIIGEIREWFDSCWAWSRKRGIGIAGPFGDGRRGFFPLSEIPPDGVYVNKETGKEYTLRFNEIFGAKKTNVIDEARSCADEMETELNELPQEAATNE